MHTKSAPTLTRVIQYFRSATTVGLLFGLLSVSTPSYAWWDLGHTVICEQALLSVSANTRSKIEVLLKGEAFGRACGWADRVRKTRPKSSPWHYINLPPGITHVSEAQHPEKGDILVALNAQLTLLKDPQADSIERGEALRWIGHLVGDLHQPMHLGYQSDWGGNNYRLAIDHGVREAIGAPKRSFVNMHQVWDGYLLIYAAQKKHGALTDLAANIAGDAQGDIPDWADASLALLNKPGVHYLADTRLSALTVDYLDANYPLALMRLREAALNLARLLEQTLNQPPTGEPY